ncbi:uncharacterized protein LOC117646084 [Thrips palmi]|uniref:Uncharacterized protein LOC117640134 n=1 Tax=Thrips palmi TaxID=161013 RepID=A0A6P8YZC4_THRPL|nr:uncharacterized protein LOC117640134 [Thrips palmi]XP_034242661.1 uncharacterized protein LOC117646084 [Thrips palmi]
MLTCAQRWRPTKMTSSDVCRVITAFLRVHKNAADTPGSDDEDIRLAPAHIPGSKEKTAMEETTWFMQLSNKLDQLKKKAIRDNDTAVLEARSRKGYNYNGRKQKVPKDPVDPTVERVAEVNRPAVRAWRKKIKPVENQFQTPRYRRDH